MAKDRVQFSREQQERVQELIDRGYSRGYRKGTTEAAIEINSLRAKIAELEDRGPLSFLRKRR